MTVLHLAFTPDMTVLNWALRFFDDLKIVTRLDDAESWRAYGADVVVLETHDEFTDYLNERAAA